MRAGDRFPEWKWPRVGGGEMDVAHERGWRMLVVYRGKHCGLCRKYLGQLQAMRAEFARADISVYALSADPREKAEAQVREGGLEFPVGYGLTVEQMRGLGLYISEPAGDADRPFAEPAVFVVNADGTVQVASVSNAPFARPELAAMREGIETARKDGAPIHGQYARR